MSIKQKIKNLYYFISGRNTCVTITTAAPRELLIGRKIIITGGGRGLGFSIARKCIDEGALVLITGRNEDKLQEAAAKLGERCKYIAYDISKIDEMSSFYEKAVRVMGGIDTLVCNAGISLHEYNILDVTLDKFDTQINTNLRGSYFIAQEFIKNRDKNCNANILFISSERGHQCDDVPYGLTKVAINSLTRGLAKRFYKEGIRVNAIAPGVTASDMTKRSATGNIYDRNQVAERIFLPEEVAEVTVFMLSDLARCVNGEVIACDAGQYISSYF